MLTYNLPIKQPIESMYLPLTLMYLDDWALVSVSGPDSIKYLQSQLTLDVAKINPAQHYIAAHCNSYGKILSNLRLFYNNNNINYIIRRKILEIQLAEIKKYAIFSKVKFSDSKLLLLGLAGFQAKNILHKIFKMIPDLQLPLVQNDETTILWIKNPIERFIILTTYKKGNFIKEKLMNNKVQFSDSKQWLALDIESGIPVIDPQNIGRFIPQSVNLQILNAINFEKGCYIGQETIARTHYLKTNKHMMYWLEGKTDNLPLANESLEIMVNNRWQCTGRVLASVKLNSGLCWIQVVMKKDIKLNSVIRVQKDENGYFKIKQLPY
ncbi:tRNA-modifying protein YgfZ [Candidatus Pantoea edessiphila]|uniref:tRNA-modifying protein YgfZ n=1 Tax=Candidatus Pantoea edessiphila TaxID=2044610 RepID=A0A2P5T1H1_9GAMM|nr:tRNA-modifying protein YgfZ [Candidatus Pantoea edessiphila]PPI88444.1 tRNA-modifying protein YgfZ [Candidatus Pantoea edessiphila]